MLITKEYLLEVLKKLVSIIWDWINSSKMSELEKRCNESLAKLPLPKHDYFLGYYQRQKRFIVQTYPSHLFNLDVESTQMVESLYTIIKSVTNRYISIINFPKQICTHIKIMQNSLQEKTIE